MRQGAGQDNSDSPRAGKRSAVVPRQSNASPVAKCNAPSRTAPWTGVGPESRLVRRGRGADCRQLPENCDAYAPRSLPIHRRQAVPPTSLRGPLTHDRSHLLYARPVPRPSRSGETPALTSFPLATQDGRIAFLWALSEQGPEALLQATSHVWHSLNHPRSYRSALIAQPQVSQDRQARDLRPSRPLPRPLRARMFPAAPAVSRRLSLRPRWHAASRRTSPPGRKP